jgi:hypothetical protein
MGIEARNPTRLVAGKVFVALLLLHISSQEEKKTLHSIMAAQPRNGKGQVEEGGEKDRKKQLHGFGVQVPDSLTVRASPGLLCTSTEGKRKYTGRRAKKPPLP